MERDGNVSRAEVDRCAPTGDIHKMRWIALRFGRVLNLPGKKRLQLFPLFFSLSLSLSLSLPLFLYELTAFNELTATPSELLVTLDLMRLKSGLRLSLVSPYLIAG